MAAYTGVIDCSGSPNYPVVTAAARYLVDTAGRIGGVGGRAVNEGDVLTTTGAVAEGTHGAVGSNWTLVPATRLTELAAEVSKVNLAQAVIEDFGVISTSVPRCGVASLTTGSLVVATAAAKATSLIFLTPLTTGLTVPAFVSDIVASTSFKINAAVTGDVAWLIVNPS
jgi:hypothetical protein